MITEATSERLNKKKKLRQHSKHSKQKLSETRRGRHNVEEANCTIMTLRLQSLCKNLKGNLSSPK